MTPEAMNGESAVNAMLLAAAAAASTVSSESSSRNSEANASNGRKRKATPSSSNSASPEVPDAGSSPASAPSTPTNAKILKMRKLKSYGIAEKLDIIDYAKVIGNRAAGREFNVAESSIREWRKNEEKIRQMAEVSPSKSKTEAKEQRTKVDAELDQKLVAYIENTHDVTWHDIGLKANDLHREAISKSGVFEDGDGEFNANMGWVSRFFKRVQDQVRTIPPPVSNPVSSHPFNEPISMVQTTPLEMPTGAVAESILSQSVSKRRKPLRPQRLDRPTLRLSPQQQDCESAATSQDDAVSKNMDLNKTAHEENLNVTG